MEAGGENTDGDGMDGGKLKILGGGFFVIDSGMIPRSDSHGPRLRPVWKRTVARGRHKAAYAWMNSKQQEKDKMTVKKVLQ